MPTLLRTIDDAINDGLDRVGEPEVVEGVLAKIADAFHADRAMTFAPIAIKNNPMRPFGHGLPLGFFDNYAAFIYEADLWRTAMLNNPQRLLQRGGSLSQELLDVPSMLRTEFYADHLLPLDVFAKVCVVIEAGSPTGVQMVTVLRDRAKGVFSEEHFRTLRAVAPAMRRLVRLQSRVVDLQLLAEQSRRGLDHLGFGLLQVSPHGDVRVANAQAREWLGWPQELPEAGRIADHGRTRVGPRFGALPNLERLHGELHRLSQEARQSGNAGGRVIGAHQRRDLLATAVHVTARPGADIVQICITTDGPSGEATRARVCGVLYGLTTAEERVAMLLMEAATPEEIAVQLSVKVSTVRSHLSALFSKTGTTRQAELVQRLLRLVPQRANPVAFS